MLPAQRPAEVLGTLTGFCPATFTVYNSLHYAHCEALVAGIASSLPSLVLRSMLKQRRILMHMH